MISWTAEENDFNWSVPTGLTLCCRKNHCDAEYTKSVQRIGFFLPLGDERNLTLRERIYKYLYWIGYHAY